jgi:beta-mannosidase
MLKYMTPEQLWPKDFEFRVNQPGKIAWPEMWQYRSAGSAWDKLGRIEQFCDPESPEDLVRAMGIAHGEYWQARIERERRGVPNGAPDGNRRCWGNLVWRLNDSWPITYMSAIDYYLEPKIAYYYLKRAYNPVLVSFEKTEDKIYVWVVNDSSQPVSGTLKLRKMNFRGKILGELSTFVHLNPGESRRCLDETPLGSIVLRRELLVVNFNKNIITLLLDGERYLHLPEATLKVEKTNKGIEISSDMFARQVTLEIPGSNGVFFEDNYFDLIPGQKQAVQIHGCRAGQKVRVKALNSEKIELKL